MKIHIKWQEIRIHDHSHPDWRQECWYFLVPGAGENLVYIATQNQHVMVKMLKLKIEYIQAVAKKGIKKRFPFTLP